jgi:hypothetical protein
MLQNLPSEGITSVHQASAPRAAGCTLLSLVCRTGDDFHPRKPIIVIRGCTGGQLQQDWSPGTLLRVQMSQLLGERRMMKGSPGELPALASGGCKTRVVSFSGLAGVLAFH